MQKNLYTFITDAGLITLWSINRKLYIYGAHNTKVDSTHKGKKQRK